MSGLLLPKRKPHWRPDWSALLMGLTLTGGHLTRTPGNHLALCADLFPVCCDGGPPDSVTFSGGTACWAAINGTFALTPHPSPSLPCISRYSEILPIPSDPCGSGFCYSVVVGGSVGTRYYHLALISIDATVSNSGPGMSLSVGLLFNPYKSLPSCGADDSILFNLRLGSTWSRDTCRTGDLIGVNDDPAPILAMGSMPTNCTVAFPP